MQKKLTKNNFPQNVDNANNADSTSKKVSFQRHISAVGIFQMIAAN